MVAKTANQSTKVRVRMRALMLLACCGCLLFLARVSSDALLGTRRVEVSRRTTTNAKQDPSKDGFTKSSSSKILLVDESKQKSSQKQLHPQDDDSKDIFDRMKGKSPPPESEKLKEANAPTEPADADGDDNNANDKPNKAPINLNATEIAEDNPFIEAIKDCKTLECLRKAHDIPREPGQFNFPHVLIAGWQKAATTSLYVHLSKHPNVIRGPAKEPEMFTKRCRLDPENSCPPEEEEQYINEFMQLPLFVENRGTVMSMEGSTHYGLNGDRVAPGVMKVLPWVKIILSVREPISRAMSLLIHQGDLEAGFDEGCLAQEGFDLFTCLMIYSQIVPPLDRELSSPIRGHNRNYSRPLTAWLETAPKGQLFLMQYEEFTDPDAEKGLLDTINDFLGLDGAKNNRTLGIYNSRKERIRPEGWPMRQDQYLTLIDIVRGDAMQVARLAQEYGFGSASKWMERWEKVWKDNLDSCDDKGLCLIRPS